MSPAAIFFPNMGLAAILFFQKMGPEFRGLHKEISIQSEKSMTSSFERKGKEEKGKRKEKKKTNKYFDKKHNEKRYQKKM